jgi:hypothetical protein
MTEQGMQGTYRIIRSSAWTTTADFTIDMDGSEVIVMAERQQVPGA